MTKKKQRELMIYEIEKRIIDIIFSTIALIILFPFFIVIMIAIKIGSHGPVFADMPKRVGKNGKLFFMYKFRSMFPNAHEVLRTDPKYKELYEKYKKNSYKLAVEEDPRINKVGKFMRKSSIDEFANFINVLKGEMSVVGPRAYFQHELDEQTDQYPHYKKYIKKVLTLKPGVTGPWQIGGRSEIQFSQRVKLDAEYADKKSILYDLGIILKTPLAVISRKGVK